MIKLLLVSPKTEQSKGGIAVWTDAFLEKCGQYDVSCDLLNIATIGERAVKGNAKRNFRDEFIRTKAIFKNLRAMLLRQNYDVAHVNTSCGTFGLIRDYLTIRNIKKKQPGCKTILHFHCDVEVQTSSKISRIFLSRILKKSDTVLVLNERNYCFLRDNYSVVSNIVPNFIDSSLVRENGKIISSEIKEALFVGYVRPEKGMRELYALSRSFPQITFSLIGEVHSEVASWDKPDNVILRGKKNHSDILLEMDKADVFVFLSHSEGFSIALLEAMSRGLPCVATDVGANKEMLENRGGVVVSVGDVTAMKEALGSVQDSQKRKEMSVWNTKKVKVTYVVEVAMKQIVKLYM